MAVAASKLASVRLVASAPEILPFATSAAICASCGEPIRSA